MLICLFIAAYVAFIDLDDQTWLSVTTTEKFVNPVVFISLPDIAGMHECVLLIVACNRDI